MRCFVRKGPCRPGFTLAWWQLDCGDVVCVYPGRIHRGPAGGIIESLMRSSEWEEVLFPQPTQEDGS